MPPLEVVLHFEYLAEPTQDEAGIWNWTCPKLEVLDLFSWRGGNREKLLHLAQARWQVPTELGKEPGPPKKLKRLVLPPKVDSEVRQVLQNCVEKHVT